jgi:transcriptional regulator with XRE-family HTH domain
MPRKICQFRSSQRGPYLKDKAYRRQYKQFLAKLRRARKEAGLSQAKAAQLLGRPQPFLSKCEAGERRVDIVELCRFARIYKKPVTYFVEPDEA